MHAKCKEVSAKCGESREKTNITKEEGDERRVRRLFVGDSRLHTKLTATSIRSRAAFAATATLL